MKPLLIYVPNTGLMYINCRSQDPLRSDANEPHFLSVEFDKSNMIQF